jgi:hypothetical protein
MLLPNREETQLVLFLEANVGRNIAPDCENVAEDAPFLYETRLGIMNNFYQEGTQSS